MNKCFLCKKNNHLSKVRNGGYVCNDCYWNKGGREKVQHSRKVSQPLRYEENKKSKFK